MSSNGERDLDLVRSIGQIEGKLDAVNDQLQQLHQELTRADDGLVSRFERAEQRQRMLERRVYLLLGGLGLIGAKVSGVIHAIGRQLGF